MKKISPLLIGLLPLVLACGEEPPAPSCGDGAVDAGEECDDGNNNNLDDCRNTCALPACGDDVVDDNEDCDDGNVSNGDACRADCTLPVCGDGAQDAGEECDDGDTTNGDGCEADCTLPFCGNNITDSTEECDDGNNISGDGCTSTCDDELCGDGVVNDGPNEECDDGNQDNLDACRNNCKTPACGDGIKDAGEACDDGNLNSGDGCDQNCTVTACGNDIVTNEICFVQGSFDAGDDITDVSLGDIDGDGDLDLAAINNSDNVTVFKNNGSGQFVAPLVLTPGAGVVSATFADVDGDQDQDMVVGILSQFFTTYRLLPNDGTGLFGAPIDLTGSGFGGEPLFDDIDGDGDLDMLVSGLGNTSIFPNDGNGAFPTSTVISDGSVTDLLDFDGDGDKDLLLSQFIGDGDINLGRNNAGQYTIEPLFNLSVFDLAPLDLGEDGDFDIVAINSFSQGTHAFENQSGTFIDQGNLGGPSLSAGATIDFNTDGLEDVIAINISQSHFLSLMLNDGVGSIFNPLDIFPLPATSSVLLVADVNGDGQPDIITNNQTTGEVLIFASNP